ncbi:cysteine synthase A [Eubacteriales bacterium OttesenSCG-928-K08]|nr:cysteine synthase A [Eubacteriales bacterium OttesenSCG-928-K08]
MPEIYPSMLHLIGNTPLVELSRFAEFHGVNSKLIAKLERSNPAGSVKDRAALGMIEYAEGRDIIHPGDTIIEPTSGNTGIGLAAVAAIKGYKVILTMQDTMSVERQKILAAYGAKVVLTPGELGMKGAIEKAKSLQKEIPGSFIAGQFENPANPATHYQTTGPEIWRQTDGQIDVLIGTVGTGGTITGTGTYLKQQNANIRIIAVEPAGSPVLSGGEAGAHKLQGIGAGFVPEVLDRDLIDEIITIEDEAAFEAGRLMAQKEGLLVGISSGAALCAAVQVGKRPEHAGKNIVVILPDTGERYLSSEMFE